MRLVKLFHYFVKIVYAKIKGDSVSDILFTAVSDFGGVYVKLVQFVCLRTNVFSEQDKLRFLSFYDEVPLEWIDINQLLEQELGQKQHQLVQIDLTPFASGTFGQVYKAVLRDGTNVVIKVKRPGLYWKLKFDFVLLKICAGLFDLFIEQYIIDLQGTLSEFERNTMQELDYLQEAHNAEHFFKLYRNHPRVSVPQTYLKLCTRNILIQEYIGGISVTELIKFKNQAGDYREWLRSHYGTDPHYLFPTIAYDLAIQGFTQDIFYADPHPGNIKFLPNNRYAFIDFGIVGQSGQNKRILYEIIAAIVKRADQMDMRQVGKLFLEWGAGDFYKQLQSFDDYFSKNSVKLTDLVLQKYASRLEEKREMIRTIEKDGKEDFFQIVLQIVSSGTILNIKVPPAVLSLLRTTIVYKSWTAYLEPEFYSMRDTYDRILKDVNPAKLSAQNSAYSSSPERALETVLEWFERVGESDALSYRKVFGQLIQPLYV